MRLYAKLHANRLKSGGDDDASSFTQLFFNVSAKRNELEQGNQARASFLHERDNIITQYMSQGEACEHFFT